MQKTIVAKTGNEAVAEAMRQINPDVCAAYPITPATEIMQIFSTFVADGLVKTNLITVESEHSAISACMGSAASGARTMTATSSQGLALMHEVLYIAAALRLPIVLTDVNRALSGPINIHCDHSDTMAERDSGWIQIFSENSQEAYDNLIQAVRIAEHKDVFLPTMVTTDGFIISHGMERLEMYPDEEIQKFIGEYKSAYNVLNVEKPITVGSIVLTDYYIEHKRAQHEAMKNAVKVIKDIGKEFGKVFGKEYDMIEKYRADDADYVLVCLGSTAGTAKVAIEELRQEGIKAGLVKIRVFRPFPAEDVVQALKNAKAVVILDRSESLSNQAGPVATEIKSALFDAGLNIPVKPYIYGLGGREIYIEQIKSVYKAIKDLKKTEPVSYLGVKE
ncbi:MAG: pyruvate ferredoxin oxidoreductase [Candidatus Goldbacteria bacterium]|nr:pyruvate ferredoxin oxidoreductase [Candidatus Goldiibacteriota bacterium]